MKTKIRKIDSKNPQKEIIEEAAAVLRAGGLVAFPTETVYGLGGNALDAKASEKIYAAKGRPSDNPLIVHIARMEDLEKIVLEVPEKAKILAAAYWPGPLTMILPKSAAVPYETTGGLESVAVRYPSHPVARDLILASGGFIAAPSANTSGRPSPTTAAHVEEDLTGAVDMILDGGQVGIGIESTIVDFTEDVPTVLRPGYISLEMLREQLGKVRMDRGLLKNDGSQHPKAPGMKYRHYAPKAELTIVEGKTDQVVNYINERAREAAGRGKQIGIIGTSETVPYYPKGLVRCIGSREDEASIALHLYEVLRDFDQYDVESIYSEAFDTPKMGQGIMNRLLKAAGHRVIRVEE